jgi:hypothetical protein
VLLLQKGKESLRRFNFDYIFSDYENNILIANSIKNMIASNEKNLCFLTFGEEKLGKFYLKTGKTKFLFGNPNKIHSDSFFKHVFDIIQNILRQDFAFDNILIDIIKIANEKFILDYVTQNLT